MAPPSAAVLAVVLVLVILPVVTSSAFVHQYVEDFTTRAYCDTLTTTAEWDTLAAEIRLPPL
jgi:hypothetical protein